MSAEFILSRKYNYDDEDMEILEHHIRQFKLNDVEYRTGALMQFIEDTIEADGKFNRRENRLDWAAWEKNRQNFCAILPKFI